MLDIGTIRLRGEALIGVFDAVSPFAKGVVSLAGQVGGDTPQDAIRIIENNPPFAEYSSNLIGQVRAVTAEPTDCPCFREPYVIPDSFSSSDQRHWKFKQAWRNGRPLLFDKRLGFAELEARGPDINTLPIVGLEDLGGTYYAVSFGDTSILIDYVIVDIRYEVRAQAYVEARNSDTIEPTDPFYQIFEDNQLLGTYYFWELDITDTIDVSAYPTRPPSISPEDLVTVIEPEPYGIGYDDQDLVPSEELIGTDERVKRTAYYYPSNNYFNIGEEENCVPKPCFLTIQPEYICSEPTDNPVVTTQSICSGVLDGNPVFSANSIRLENDCFKICDTPPCLKRRQ